MPLGARVRYDVMAMATESNRIAPSIAFALAVLLAAAVPGCDARDREIRAGLSDEELLLFDRGQKVSSSCWACHDFYGTQNKVGPYLSGVMGRRAGSATFPGYSQALRGSGIVWSRATLSSYLRNPQAAVPGTNMVAPGVASPGDLEALLFYIEQATVPTSGATR